MITDRQIVDQAIYSFIVKVQGSKAAGDYNYESFNELLDDIEAIPLD